MIRIFFVVSPGVVAEDGVDLQQAKQKNQPGAYFRAGQIVHAMVAIAQVEHLLQAGRLQESLCITFVGENGFPQS